MKCVKYTLLCPLLLFGEMSDQELADQIEAKVKMAETLREISEKKALEIGVLTALIADSQAEEALSPCGEPPPPEKCYCSELERYRPDPCQAAIMISGEYLYWRTLEGTTDYALLNQTPTPTESSAIGKYKEAKFDWDSGLRIGVGYRFQPNFWEANLQWTYFSNSGKQLVRAPISPSLSVLVGTFNQTTNGVMLRAKSDIDISFNIIDFSLGKRLFIQDQLLLKFFTAISGAWIDQEWRIDYKSNVNNDFLKLKWDFSGGGIRSGFFVDWFLGWGFGIHTQLSGAGYVGSYHNTSKYTEQTSLGAINTRRDSRFDDTRFVFNLQYQLGLDWGMNFRSGGNLNFFLGYEIQPWFNLHEVNRALFASGTTSRDSRLSRGLVAPQGLTASAKVNF